MELEALLSRLTEKNTTPAYAALQELERLSDESAALYPYTERFIEMLDSGSYAVRVRGFRLLCKQAKWDVDGVIDKNIDHILGMLNDSRPTAVRQALAALHEVVPCKRALCGVIKEHVLAIDPLRYQDTMHRLILQDMQSLIEAIG